MTTKVLVSVKFLGDSGLPTDIYVQDWVFEQAAALTQADANQYASDLSAEFYNFGAGPQDRIATFMSPVVKRGANEVKVECYDISTHLDGSAHGSPAFVSTFTLGAASTASPIPSECAIVLSFHSDLVGVVEKSGATRPGARHRGRVFLGPWDRNAVNDSGAGAFVDLGLQANILAAASNFLSQVTETWVQWSRKDAVVRPVIAGFLDNAFDTQRSRGEPANGRTIWT